MVKTEKFIRRAIEIHGDRYEYSKVHYVHSEEKVIIICRIHNDFEQSPKCHLRGQGCSKCRSKKMSLTKEQFIEKAEKLHKGKYSYEKTNYVHSRNKVVITCNIHGDFKQRASSHLQGEGCLKCGKESHWRRSEYVKKAKDRICTFYTLRCFNEDEEFYKIGITMSGIKKRYNHTSHMPYSYEVISEIKGEASFIWDLESQEKRKLKEFNYQPFIKFDGSKTECFTKYKI